jgi:hypothetical protein
MCRKVPPKCGAFFNFLMKASSNYALIYSNAKKIVQQRKSAKKKVKERKCFFVCNTNKILFHMGCKENILPNAIKKLFHMQ